MKVRQVLLSWAGGVGLTLLTAYAGIADDGFDKPAGAHFSAAKLERIGAFFEKEIANGKIPGAILLIQQHGKPVYSQFFGVRDLATKQPMTADTIFHLHSMTKPITSFAAMLLIDQGRLRLDDPVAKYIPAFATMKVGVEKAIEGGKALQLVPLARPITIKDLMTHTSGLTYGFYGDSLIRKTWGNSNIYDGDLDNAAFAERVAKLPLAEQPGTLWDYGHSTDILGRVIEVVSGQSLYQFEKQALLDPLLMTGTGFFVTAPERLKLQARPVPSDTFENTADIYMKWESGGGGMVTTLKDFARFSQMLLNGGVLDGRRYLRAENFKLMTTDHIGPSSGVARDYYYFPGDGYGFGLGFGVRTDPGLAKPPPPGSLGELKWDGASGCYFVIDPKQDLFFVLLQQTFSERQRIQTEVKRLIYEALEN
ncbi:CubicO group peptidase (beta-lactamase class C family) [Rhodopseudomonas rhenobacensis]|uniref:CubicO group peptidase (Beta-lactamase class C family) n=1 Tax=Rhodopseudomonas rhenobacensis TaxID=87461 RepID=A0A7W7Z8F2_9BRAD|nr:serine hydrolase domain-containing protein [Rhodopseudomonas rhenobacensis]MBB5049407.1 CubicO group peptidase (beta-lactamase class C family) [Rhodopseudomonas rhenobacensis]